MNPVCPLFVTQWFTHHSAVSGYDQLARRWQGPSHMLELQSLEHSRRRVPGRVGMLLRLMRIRGTNALHLYRATKQFAPKINLIHVLYGEMDLPLPSHVAGRLPVLATFHQPPSHLARSHHRLAHLRRQLADVNMILALCKEQEDFFRDLVGSQRVRLVPHGVDTAFFQPGSGNRRRDILLVGGWLRDWNTASCVLGRLVQMDTRVEVHLVNPASDNPLLRAFPSDRLRVTGRLSDNELLHEYQTCGVVFFPFHAATANNALLEACACGCRIVATDIGGVQDYVARSARLFTPDTDMEVVASMLMQELDRAQSTPTDAEAVRRAADHDWTVITTKMLQVYHESVMAHDKLR